MKTQKRKLAWRAWTAAVLAMALGLGACDQCQEGEFKCQDGKAYACQTVGDPIQTREWAIEDCGAPNLCKQDASSAFCVLYPETEAACSKVTPDSTVEAGPASPLKGGWACQGNQAIECVGSYVVAKHDCRVCNVDAGVPDGCPGQLFSECTRDGECAPGLVCGPPEPADNPLTCGPATSGARTTRVCTRPCGCANDAAGCADCQEVPDAPRAALNQRDGNVCEAGFCVQRQSLKCATSVTNVHLSPQSFSLSSFRPTAPFLFTADFNYLDCTLTTVFVGVNAPGSGSLSGPPTLVAYPLTKQSSFPNGERWGVDSTLAPWAGVKPGVYELMVTAHGSCSSNITEDYAQMLTTTMTVTP